MSPRDGGTGRRLCALLAVGVLVAGATALAVRTLEPPGRPGELAGRTATPEARGPTPAGDPLRVRIPAIGVDAPLRRLGLNGDGTLEVPGFEEAGWYSGGPRPGEPGPAVVAAHLDSTTGPAVFYRLGQVRPGDVVLVDYGDGTATFAVQRSDRFAKLQFPTETVYGPTDGPELRLVTCDGDFDRRTRSYKDNLIVWATSAAPG